MAIIKIMRERISASADMVYCMAITGCPMEVPVAREFFDGEAVPVGERF
ncbi:MAG: hypothetical protein LAN61_12380 [Acidobacteriia bacterium]|nr:hypothetical protein [Terriglobia bacterium]